jgi:nucleoside-diphosphate-sugar epimerase
MATTELIAVSGYAGLLGSAFSELRSPRLTVVATAKFSELPAGLIEVEVERLYNLGVKTLLHLAWPAGSNGDNYKFSRRNFIALEQTLFLKNACQKYGIRFVGVGTGVDKQLNPATPYSLAKYVTREILLEDILNGQISWVRPFFVFDSAHWPRYVHDFDVKPLLIRDDSPRDFIHLHDVATGLQQIILGGISGEIDLGSGLLRRPSDICRALGREFVVVDDEDSFVPSLEPYSPARHHALLAELWSPSHTSDFFIERN